MKAWRARESTMRGQIVPNCDRPGKRGSDALSRLSAGLTSENMPNVGAPAIAGLPSQDPTPMFLVRALFLFALLVVATPSFAARCGRDFNSCVTSMPSAAHAAGVTPHVA